eukprot:gb/GEZN01006303.1/.p1 GENE.gb/GEZN01006303.1/~~gb/GEZN01006303.1/.p1  ORF type:complete len:520 (-),score=50.87 gb/GEZN01006303.1/:106-1665(-)
MAWLNRVRSIPSSRILTNRTIRLQHSCQFLLPRTLPATLPLHEAHNRNLRHCRHASTHTAPPLALEELTAICPIDGRYGSVTRSLRPYFSEFGLIKRRVYVEVKWLQFLCSTRGQDTGMPLLSKAQSTFLDNLASGFGLDDARRVKQIELTTRHDVKAVEYFLKEKLQASKLDFSKHLELLHFAITSEDINNLSYAVMVKDAMNEQIYPAMLSCEEKLRELAHEWSEVPLLGRTHGQPATPTTVGKELANFAYRLKHQRQRAKNVVILGKINGAVGCFNAHLATYPELDWPSLCAEFITSLGLQQNTYTTQIEPHDWIGELFDAVAGYNTVLLDCSRDMWGYISREVFRQPAVPGEIGSSTMPHKVNPIDFENAEGNLGLANCIFHHFANKLPVSRFQRDLSDSTVLRNIGVGLAHSVMSYHSALRGLNKVSVNQQGLDRELDQHWEVLAEPIQTIMRRYNVPEPYEKLKELTRGKQIDKSAILAFVCSLDIPQAEKTRLLAMTPASYIGYAAVQAKQV